VTNIPEGAELIVEDVAQSKYDDYLNQAAAALRTDADAFTYAKLLDISIVYEGQEIQPNGKVGVEIQLKDGKDISNPQVVHFGQKTEVLNAAKTGNGVAFETTGFSIYAVVGEGDEGDYARMTIHFMNDSEEIAQMIVKNGDTEEELEYIIYDPGVGELEAGELFKGWTMKEDYSADDAKNPYNAETNPNGYMTIQDIREWAAGKTIKEHEDQNFYAMVFKTYSVAFLDEDGVTTHGEALIFKSNDSYTEYVIEQDYTPKNPDLFNFEGWYWNSDTIGAVKSSDGEVIPQNSPIPVGTTVQISGNVTFSPNPAAGYWLIFNANGKNVSYTPSQFIKSGTRTQEPAKPTRFGYTFVEWCSDEACTQPFTFGEELTGRTELYAKWQEVSTAGYTVIIWKEKSGDTYANNAAEGKTRTYDYWTSYNFVGNVGDTINAVSDSNRQTSDINGSYYDVRVRGTKSDGASVDEIVSELGYHTAKYDENVKITPEGTAIVNVYYDRHTVTYTFHYPFGYTYTATTDNDNNPQKYGTFDNDNYFNITRSGGRWYYYQNGWQEYNGTPYVRSNNGSWQNYQEEIGLYGEKLNWPADTSIYWYPNGYNNGTVDGTRMTYKNDFIPLNADMSVDYYGVAGSGNQEIRFYTQDLDNPNNYTMQYSVSASNVGDFNVNDKFTGFHAYQTRSYTGGYYGGWSNWSNVGALNPNTGIYGDPVAVNSILEIRYNRIYNTIAFMDGKYFDGNGIEQEEDNQGMFHETDEMFYETDLTSYNEGGANYYTPPAEKIPAGYAFGGWYADEECTVKYNFTTMPVTGVTVYAKWVKIQYRVFLHPNVPVDDISYDIGGQNTSFRANYGEKIANGKSIDATRNDYQLIGWYLDEACTKIYSFDAYTLRDDATTLAGESLFSDYDKTEDTELDKYGNTEAGKQGVNKDKDPNEDGDYADERFWITKKVDLYAKWRSVIVGAPGIRVQYDAWQDDEVTGKIAYISGQPRSYMDPLTYYLDRAEATAAAASTPDDDKLQFLYWVVQRWDESAQKYVDTDINVYPGDTFEVLKANARVVDIENPSQEQIDAGVTKTYTVQVRAQYGDKEEHTPTHIVWYPNFDTEQQPKTDDNLRINEAVDIEPSTLFEREGYNFVGWAREPEYAATDTQHTTPITQYPDATAWLTWDGSDFTVTDTGNTATQVAADERLPYHGMYAVWEPKPYTVTVEKVVEGTEEDKATDFTFNSSLSVDSFTLRDTQTKEFKNVNYDSTFTVSETENENFTTSYSYKIGESGEAVTFEPGASITVKGDMYVTVTNTRKEYSVDIAKTDKSGTALNGAVFEVNKKDGEEYKKYIEENLTVNDFVNVKLTPGDYELVETTAPDGYLLTANKYHFTLGTNGNITVTSAETFADGTVIVTKETAKTEGSVGTVSIKNEPGKELPKTGGSGTLPYTLGGFILMISALMYGFRMRRRERRLI